MRQLFALVLFVVCSLLVDQAVAGGGFRREIWSDAKHLGFTIQRGVDDLVTGSIPRG